MNGGVNKVILILAFSHRGGLEEGMPFERCSGCMEGRRCNDRRLLDYRKHILVKNGYSRTFSCGVLCKAEAGIQIVSAIFPIDSRIELRVVALLLTKQGTVFVVDETIEFIGTGRCVTYCHGYDL